MRISNIDDKDDDDKADDDDHNNDDNVVNAVHAIHHQPNIVFISECYYF